MVSKSLLIGLVLYAGFPTAVESQSLGDSKIAVSITDGDLRPWAFVQMTVDQVSHSKATSGLVIGAAAGGAIGALLAYLQTHRRSIKDHSEDDRAYLVLIPAGAVVGGIVGALVGGRR